MGEESTLRDKLALAAVAVAVIVLPGLANFAIGELGYPTVGSIVWAVGYGSGVLMIWYVWVRPLDISAPESADRYDPDEE